MKAAVDNARILVIKGKLKVQKPNWFSLIELRDLFERRPWSMLSWASGLVAMAFIGYYGILALGNPPSVIGEQFVLAEFPPTSISPWFFARSEEHTSELQSLTNLVCRLLLEKKKTNTSH